MPLSAELTIGPAVADAAERFVAFCTLTNTGDRDEEINVAAMSSPSLALEIRAVDGEPVLQPPPSVPRAQPPIERLAPGERYEAEFRGFLPSWTPPGDYEARCRYVAGATEAIRSDWIGFRLTRRG